ncbi:MAG: glutaredoxin 3 [Rhodobacteraceae bacterium]|nr:glutaredoxin 3 [Paracoccaceae bacterium]MCP5341361.1 glutaredoxin 3 [Paracoccaceae bacterium]
MQRIEIYTTPFCPYCHAAKRLLASKGAVFEEINVAGDPAKRQEMMTRAHGRHTVPQIFIDGKHVGGSDELHSLDRAGGLDPLLSAG